MPSNFPTAYDSLANLGGPFINVAPPVDPLRNIDADKANLWVDSILALENRVGKLGEITQTTVDWALLTVAGVPNQGLRITPAGYAAWPGLVAESGLFIDSATGDVCYHKAGNPAATFTNLTLGVTTWDELYASDKTLSEDAAEVVWEQVAGSLGSALRLTRNLASAQTDSPLFLVENLNVGDDQDSVLIRQSGAGNILSLVDSSGPAVRWIFRRDGSVDGSTNENPDPLLSLTHNGVSGSVLRLWSSGLDVLDIEHDGRMQIRAASAWYYWPALQVSQGAAARLFGLYDETTATLWHSVELWGSTYIGGYYPFGDAPLLTLDQEYPTDPIIDFWGNVDAISVYPYPTIINNAGATLTLSNYAVQVRINGLPGIYWIHLSEFSV